jgi:hypothetical protein
MIDSFTVKISELAFGAAEQDAAPDDAPRDREVPLARVFFFRGQRFRRELVLQLFSGLERRGRRLLLVYLFGMSVNTTTNLNLNSIFDIRTKRTMYKRLRLDRQRQL